MIATPRGPGTLLVALVIAVVTIAAFASSLPNGFTDWDDNANFLDNDAYRGLGWPQIRWMFTSARMGHWIPVTWLTLGFDYAVWGMNPVGYHLTSLLFHAANGGLFFVVALALLRAARPTSSSAARVLGAAAAALLFTLHPLRAESVAWVTERRDVVSGFFFMLTLAAYLRAVAVGSHRRRAWMAASVGTFALGLASKSVLVSLPIILVLLDVYPLRRLPPRPREWLHGSRRAILVEKVPFITLAVVGAVVALLVVRAHGFFTELEAQPLGARVALALHSLVFYVVKTVVPVGLSPLYELPARVDPLAPRFVGAGALALAVTVALVVLRRRWPAALPVWIAYVVMLLPNGGLLHNGVQLAADRYSYLACLGWALLAGAGVTAVADARGRGVVSPTIARAAAAGVTVWLAGLGALSWQQSQTWRDAETMWRHALAVDPGCTICHHHLGLFLDGQGRVGEAKRHFEAALVRRPAHVPSTLSLSATLVKMGRADEATALLDRRFGRAAADANVRSHLGFALLEAGRTDEAVEQLEAAVRLSPRDPQSATNLGIALVALKRAEAAVPHLQRAVSLSPGDPLPRYWLATAHSQVRKNAAARGEIEILRRIAPR